tara:strand:+ start:255 stop:632 length:378 start_codon:yes stop_codon:yes gene_type:complete
MITNKKFGLSFAGIFLVVSIFFAYAGSPKLTTFFFIISVILLPVSFFFERILYYPKIIWMSLGLLLGKVINPIVMGIIFFLIFSPIGILLRVFGRDELEIRKSYNSAWINMQNLKKDLNYFKNQF